MQPNLHSVVHKSTAGPFAVLGNDSRIVIGSGGNARSVVGGNTRTKKGENARG